MTTIPVITEQDIRSIIGDASFQRGQRYFRDDRIFDPRRAGLILKAKCEGSRSIPYRVEVTFNDTGIAATDCSCPIGGYCKHVVALLLTWLEQPKEFIEQQDIDAILEQCDKAELIALVKQMLRREPDLEYLLTTVGKADTPVDPHLYHNQVETTFRRAGNQWGAEAEVADELLAIKENADGFAQRQDFASAVAVYEAIVTGIIDHHYEYEDESGELSGVIYDCVEELRNWLDEVREDNALRERIVRMLFAIYRFNVEAGGIEFGEDAPTVLLEETTVEERKVVAGWVRDELAKKDSTEWSGKFRKQWLGRFLLQLEEETLDDETYLRICRETGRIKDAVERLLELRRVDEAVEEAKAVDDYELLSMADLFVKAGQGTVAEQIMQERVWKSRDSRILEWLYKRYQAREDPATTLLQAEINFRSQQPTLGSYKQVRELAIQFDRWEKIRPALLASLKTYHSDLLIQIALDEGDVDQLLAMVKYDGTPAHAYGYKINRVFDALKTAEETHPDTLLTLYRKFVEYQIEQRNRQGYAVACRFLVVMRTLYEKLGKGEAWTSYITELREKNHSLRVLKEIMAAMKI